MQKLYELQRNVLVNKCLVTAKQIEKRAGRFLELTFKSIEFWMNHESGEIEKNVRVPTK